MIPPPTASTSRAPLVFAALVAVVAVGWRLVGLTDWPSPAYPTLQYESALAARTVWLAADPRARTPDRAAWLDAAGTQYVTSPPVLPGLVAAVYAATGEETPWVSRLFATGFWLAAGGLIGAAAVRLTCSRWAGAVGFAWFVLCPVGMVMSRSFQVEAVLVFALAAATYHLARRGRGLTWRETVRTAVVCGIASLVKPGILFLPLIAAFAVVVLPRSVHGRVGRKALHLAVVVAVVVLPGTAYARLLLSHHTGRMMPHLLVEGWYYRGVAETAWGAVGPALLVGLVGIGMAARAGVYLPVGLLVGHLGTLAVFTFHAATHDYYQVPLLAITAVGLAWPVAWAERRLAAQGWGQSRLSHIALGVGLAAAVAAYLVATRNPAIGPWRWLPENRAALERAAAERRFLADQAAAVRATVGSGTPVIELAEGYGYPLRYDGWADVVSWPRLAGRPYMAGASGKPFSADEELQGLLAKRPWRYFVVTDWYEWEGQPDLRAALAGYGPPREPAPGVLIFDLRPGNPE